jgi:hypothetical protein
VVPNSEPADVGGQAAATSHCGCRGSAELGAGARVTALARRHGSAPRARRGLQPRDRLHHPCRHPERPRGPHRRCPSAQRSAPAAAAAPALIALWMLKSFPRRYIPT